MKLVWIISFCLLASVSARNVKTKKEVDIDTPCVVNPQPTGDGATGDGATGDGATGDGATVLPKSCKEIKNNNADAADGVYDISVGSSNIEVWCDMTTDNGGWTTLQRRFDGTVDFNRDFADYERGFGDKNGEHWLGLDPAFELTKVGSWELRVDLGAFDGTKKYAKYSEFRVGAAEKYTLGVGGYSGDAGDSMAGQHYSNNGMAFSTRDRDQDGKPNGSCADFLNGAWWWAECGQANLNANSYGDGGLGASTMHWYHYTGGYTALKTTTMSIREK